MSCIYVNYVGALPVCDCSCLLASVGTAIALCIFKVRHGDTLHGSIKRLSSGHRSMGIYLAYYVCRLCYFFVILLTIRRPYCSVHLPGLVQ